MREDQAQSVQDTYKELSAEVGESPWMLPGVAFSFVQPPKDRSSCSLPIYWLVLSAGY